MPHLAPRSPFPSRKSRTPGPAKAMRPPNEVACLKITVRPQRQPPQAVQNLLLPSQDREWRGWLIQQQQRRAFFR